MIKNGEPKFTEQPGSVLIHEQDGLMRGQRILIGDITLASQVPARWSPHPLDPLALCFQRKFEYIKLGRIKATLDYIGIDNDPTEFIYEMNGALNKDPIETHKDFVSRIGGTVASPKNKAQFDPDTGEFLCFPPDAPQDLGGTSDYFIPTVNVRRTWWTYTVPTMDQQGKIVAKPSDIILSATTKNLLGGPECYRQVGKLYQMSQELIGSGPRGWNTIIYPG